MAKLMIFKTPANPEVKLTYYIIFNLGVAIQEIAIHPKTDRAINIILKVSKETDTERQEANY